MHRDHKPLLCSFNILRAIGICGQLKPIIVCSIIDVCIPSRYQKPALIIITARLTYGIHKDLIVGINVCICFCRRIAIISIKLLIHGFKDQMFIIRLKTHGNLFPACFILCLDLLLLCIILSAVQPASFHSCITIPMHINNGIKIIIHTHVHYLLHSVKPSRINGIIRLTSDLT